MENKDFLKNGLGVCLDWLEFTATECDTVSYVLERLGLDSAQFETLDKGGYGYKSCVRHCSEAVSVFYNGNENMGVHVRVSGSAISFVLRSFRDSCMSDSPFGLAYNVPFEFSVENILPYYLSRILEFASITRLDLAVDDFGCAYFSTADVVSLLTDLKCVSKFRTWRNMYESSITGGVTGHTVYLGSRTSEVMLRVYDKQLEQNADFPWVRWELELKGERANVAAQQLVEKQNLGSVCVGILSHYVRFINKDNENVSRCSTNETWERFIDGISPLALTVPVHEQSVEKKQDWVQRQVLPTIAGLLVAYNGDMEAVFGDLPMQFLRLSRDTRDMFEAYSRSGG